MRRSSRRRFLCRSVLFCCIAENESELVKKQAMTSTQNLMAQTNRTRSKDGSSSFFWVRKTTSRDKSTTDASRLLFDDVFQILQLGGTVNKSGGRVREEK